MKRLNRLNYRLKPIWGWARRLWSKESFESLPYVVLLILQKKNKILLLNAFVTPYNQRSIWYLYVNSCWLLAHWEVERSLLNKLLATLISMSTYFYTNFFKYLYFLYGLVNEIQKFNTEFANSTMFLVFCSQVCFTE